MIGRVTPYLRAGTLTGGMLWSVAARVGSVGLGAVTTLVLARGLGPQGTGSYALALLVPSLLALIVNLGLAPSNTFLVGTGAATPRAVGQTSVLFCLIGTGVAVLIVGALYPVGAMAWLIPGLAVGALAVGMLSLPVLMLRDALSAILLGLRKVQWVALQGLIQAVTCLSAMIVAIALLKAGTEGALAAYVLGGVASLALVLWRLRGSGTSLQPRFHGAVAHNAATFGMLIAIGQAIQFLNYRLDVFFVNRYSGVAAVGEYTVSARLSELLWIVPAAVGMVVFPHVAGGDARRMIATTRRTFWATIALGTVSAGFLALIGQPVIRVAFGAGFADAFIPMLILLPGSVLLGAAGIIANDLAGRGAPAGPTVAASVAVVVTVVLDIVLIPRYGIAGAAWASSAAYAVYAFAVVERFLRKTDGSVGGFLGLARGPAPLP